MSRVLSMQRMVVVVVAEVITLAALACMKSVQVSSTLNPNHPECPHDWGQIAPPAHQPYDSSQVTDPWGRAPFVVPPTGLSVPGPNTNVPEFNDCQKLIFPDGRKYGPLIAIFGSARNLDSAFADTTPGTKVYAAAEVFNYSQSLIYSPLGIGPLFNCLYVYGKFGHLKAVMVQVRRQDSVCGELADTGGLHGVQLAVVQTRVGAFKRAADYPGVARWDWDKKNNIQYIGIKCGAAWCEIGPGTAADPSKAAFTASWSYTPAAGSTAATDRVRAIKGWGDRQPMLSCGGADASDINGTIVPDWNLANVTLQAFNQKQFVDVAYVALEDTGNPADDPIYKCYKDKFNWDKVDAVNAPLVQWNVQSLCYGTISDCSVPTTTDLHIGKSCTKKEVQDAATAPRWWARLTSAAPGSTQIFRCVTYNGPTLADGAQGTANFRWLAKDETTWVWCVDGCCMVDGDS